MTKSEFKRMFTQDQENLFKKFNNMETTLKVIYTWSNFDGLDTSAVHNLCEISLGIKEK